MKKIIIATLLFSFSSLFVYAQKETGSTYKSAIGVRLGGGYYDLAAVSFKTFVTRQGALELDAGFRPYSYGPSDWFNLSFSASFQQHFDIKKVAGLKWFVGGGATVFNSFSDVDYYRGVGFGIFPTGGVDYKFANIPLNLSADIRPYIAIAKPYKYYDSFYWGNAGVSARYTFR